MATTAELEDDFAHLQDDLKFGHIPPRRFLAKILWNARNHARSPIQRSEIIQRTLAIAHRFYPRRTQQAA